jgi:uncharacterized protein (UPF0179 family)
LSKARSRWGLEAFQRFFENIVRQCAEAGLVDGSKIFVDSSMVDADASNNSVVNQQSLKRYLNRSYRELEKRLEEQPLTQTAKKGAANRKYISTTDPDASVVRVGKGGSRPRYKTHRAVDERTEIITATEVTPGEVNEAHRLEALIDQHQSTTGKTVQTAVADSKYGTIENYLACSQREVKTHFESVEKGQRGSGRRKGIFDAAQFVYHRDQNYFICPAGQRLTARKHNHKYQYIVYAASPKTCNGCKLKPRCTRAKTGRTVKRHVRQDELDPMLAQSQTRQAKRDIAKRQHLMERSFAHSTRFGYQRARWRRCWRVQIQEYLTAAIQNIKVLVRNVKEHGSAAALKLPRPRPQRSFATLKAINVLLTKLILGRFRYLTI